MKDDNVAVPDVPVGQQTVPAGAAAVAKFIHQQVVADQQRLLHGFRRDGEGLQEEVTTKTAITTVPATD